MYDKVIFDLDKNDKSNLYNKYFKYNILLDDKSFFFQIDNTTLLIDT